MEKHAQTYWNLLQGLWCGVTRGYTVFQGVCHTQSLLDTWQPGHYRRLMGRCRNMSSRVNVIVTVVQRSQKMSEEVVELVDEMNWKKAEEL